MSHQYHVRSEDLSWRQVEDEVVVLDLRSSTYLSLNGSGALLWTAMADGADAERLTALLVDTFQIDQAAAAGDVAAFLDRCIGLGIVR